jgi:phospholipid/cholesterol/gamma-HCH transport system substrate-binding protein
MKRNVRQQIVVGIFVVAGIALVAATVFVLGSEEHLFERQVKYKLEFQSIGGLKPGAVVRLAGMEVGSVVDIHLPEKLEHKKVHVIIQVQSSVKERIREDTVATIGSRGLLGDKAVDLTVGSMGEPVIEPGHDIDTEEPPDYFQFLEKGQKILDRGANVADSLDEALVVFKERKTADDIADILSSTSRMMDEVESGEGIAHTLIYDEQASHDLKQTMSHLKSSAKNIEQGTRSLDDVAQDARKLLADVDDTVGRVDRVIAAIEKGDGTAHALIYDEEGKEIFAAMATAAGALQQVVAAIRDEEGLVHKIVYDDESAKIVDDLQAAAEQIREITESINEGEGSVGAIIKDPTVYEDLKLILGEVKRNKMLKALVRYAIEQDEKKDSKFQIPTVEEVYGEQDAALDAPQ